MDRQKYSATPLALWTYIEELQTKDPSHPVSQAIGRQGEETTFETIDDLFRITSQNTGLEPDRLLLELGFDEKNQDPNHLQAILGVMRAINMLHAHGFLNIQPLRTIKTRRESDLIAEYKGTRFAIEVFRSSEASYRYSEHHDPVHNLESYIARRFNEKSSQLEATMKAHKCQKALLVVVMDSFPAKQLTESNQWPMIVKKTFESIGKPVNTRLLVFTGLKDPVTDKDECAIHPPLDC